MWIDLTAVPDRLEQVCLLCESASLALKSWGYRPGDMMTVRAPDGACFRGRLMVDRQSVLIREFLDRRVEPLYPRCLYQAIPNRERMRWIIEKAVELGVTTIQPVSSEKSYDKSNQKPKQDKSTTWNKVVCRAARQCRRGVIPSLKPVDSIEKIVHTLPEHVAAFALDLPGVGVVPLTHVEKQEHTHGYHLFVGPEGGWSAAEQALFDSNGIQRINLGMRVLRTETAAVAVLAVLETYLTS
ncbi:MAG: RNA methyltransferase [Magnetococcales bacterium]|nr:RNA methyltransferase [Magnetococcales bacterium]